MSTSEVAFVKPYRQFVRATLRRSQSTKENAVIEPALPDSSCETLIAGIVDETRNKEDGSSSKPSYAALETVFREEFYQLLATSNIEESSFSQIWNLLDIVSILSDQELCEPSLIFWLIEELLDSQTIDGCRKVFDYLESRRERITAKHFTQKNLIILRCCNELLRRLSRAEDTVFCGRVFIFLFQSFPLGDKSSVNLRGEYHVENVTTFDSDSGAEDHSKAMDIDVASSGTIQTAETGSQLGSLQKPETSATLNDLYPAFWSLQADFSAPTRLFDAQTLAKFKTGIKMTMACFERMNTGASVSQSKDSSQYAGFKRKRTRTDADVAGRYNPKYLTNRDLFDLEVHDIAFRRHILVQALIILDFLLSLTPAAKTKLADLSNKSVLYAFTLSESDAQWATSTKSVIASYLQQGSGNEGKAYYRMVDMVLSRDKNWVHWKAENCPKIDRPPVAAEQYAEAQKTLQKLCTPQPLPIPFGANDLAFLSSTATVEDLTDPSRYAKPSMEEYYKGIQNDELDAEMGTEEEVNAAQEAKDSKIWRALRASRNRFALCEKIENGKNLGALIGLDPLSKQNPEEAENIAPSNTEEDTVQAKDDVVTD